MKILFFGHYDRDYARNSIIRTGLLIHKVELIECNISKRCKLWKRPLLLIYRFLKLKCFDFDYIFLPEVNQDTVFLAKLISILFGKKIIFDIFFSLYDSIVKDRKLIKAGSLKAMFYHALDRWSLKLSDIILCDTREHMKYYIQEFWIHKKNIFPLYVGAENNIYYPEEKKSEREDNDKKKFKVLFWGKFIPLHGVDFIIEAAGLLRDNQDIIFQLLGRGQTLPQSKRKVAEMKLHNVQFLPFVKQDVLRQYIAEADLCLGIFGKSDKANRVIPHKVYQALAMKKPVITADTPAIKEVFCSGKHLFTCNRDNPRALAEIIVDLKRNRAKALSAAANGYRLFLERFTPERIGADMLKILKGLDMVNNSHN